MNRETRRVKHIVLYTTVDAQCGKMAAVVGRIKLTTLACDGGRVAAKLFQA